MRISRDSLGTAFVRMLAFLLVAAGLLGCPVWTQDETPTRPEAGVPMKIILVARERIRAFVLIEEPEKLFVKADYPADLAKKAVTDFEKLKGQRLSKTLEENKPVFEDDLLTREQAGGRWLPPAKHLPVTVEVNPESLVGGLVQPGSRVNVICTLRGKEAMSRVILENMLVLAVEQEKRQPDQPGATLVRTVTLAVKPEEANRLALGSSVGELRLTLHAPGVSR
jgi:Flp pilus assembly protein CpaB